MGYKRELEQPNFPDVSSKERRLLADDDDGILEFDISYSGDSFSSFMKLFGVDAYDGGDEADSLAAPYSSESSRSVVISPDPPGRIRFPRKPVPVGPDHQADLPDPVPLAAYLRTSAGPAQGRTIWRPSGRGPLPEAGRVTCDCFDLGSIPCVRQHVGEARREAEGGLTRPVFASLGMAEMGETVAERWSTEEEAEFYNIVCTNPRSSGRRFWRILEVAFASSRTRAELVGYYFNVFMLRRRAVQNRLGPVYVDSDDDGPPTDLGSPFSEEDEDEPESGLYGPESGLNGPESGLNGPESGLYGPELGLYGPGGKEEGGCGLGLKEEYWGEEGCSGNQKKVELPAWSVVERLLE